MPCIYNTRPPDQIRPTVNLSFLGGFPLLFVLYPHQSRFCQTDGYYQCKIRCPHHDAKVRSSDCLLQDGDMALSFAAKPCLAFFGDNFTGTIIITSVPTAEAKGGNKTNRYDRNIQIRKLGGADIGAAQGCKSRKTETADRQWTAFVPTGQGLDNKRSEKQYAIQQSHPRHGMVHTVC